MRRNHKGSFQISAMILPLLSIVFVAGLILLSHRAVTAAGNGLKLWAGIVVPSLFPFFVAVELIHSTGLTKSFGRLLEFLMRPVFRVPGCASFALVMGLISGYPVGAKITCDMRLKGELTKTEGERLLAYTNNSGPLFIIGAVGTGMYGSQKIGVFLLCCHVLASLTTGFLFRFYGPKASKHRLTATIIPASNRIVKMQPVGLVLGNAIKSSIQTILMIGGFIVLFSVLISFLSATGFFKSASDLTALIFSGFGIYPDRQLLVGVWSGLLEITNGSGIISASSGASQLLQLASASFVIGWAGLSVHFQVISIISETDLSCRSYLLGKLMHGVLSALYCSAAWKVFHLEEILKQPVLGERYHLSGNWLHDFLSSICVVLILFIAYIITEKKYS